MAFTTLTMSRHGQFNVTLTGQNHCGLKRTNVFQYHCEITVLSESVDYRGFMIDQLEVAAVFDAITTTDLSCEQLAQHAARRVFSKLLSGTEKENILRIACTISPMPQASMTFTWQKYQVCVR